MTQLLTHNEAAAQLGVNPATLHRWRQRGLIACRKRGRWVRYAIEDIEKFLEESKIEAEGRNTRRKSNK